MFKLFRLFPSSKGKEISSVDSRMEEVSFLLRVQRTRMHVELRTCLSLGVNKQPNNRNKPIGFIIDVRSYSAVVGLAGSLSRGETAYLSSQESLARSFTRRGYIARSGRQASELRAIGQPDPEFARQNFYRAAAGNARERERERVRYTFASCACTFKQKRSRTNQRTFPIYLLEVGGYSKISDRDPKACDTRVPENVCSASISKWKIKWEHFRPILLHQFRNIQCIVEKPSNYSSQNWFK